MANQPLDRILDTSLGNAKAQSIPSELASSLQSLSQSLNKLPVFGSIIQTTFGGLIPVLQAFSRAQDSKKKDADNAKKQESDSKKQDSALQQQGALRASIDKLTSVLQDAVSAFRSASSHSSSQKPQPETYGFQQSTYDFQEPLPSKPNLVAPPKAKSGAKGASGAAEGAEGAAEGAGEGFAAAGIALGALAAAAAAVAVAFAEIQKAVQAFSPATMEQFNKAIDNFNATIGAAFVSTIVDLTEAIRQATGAIAPLLDSLKPTIQELSDIFANYLVAYVKLAANEFSAFIPIIKILADAFNPLLQVVLLIENGFVLLIRAFALVLEVFLGLSPIGPLLKGLGAVLEVVNNAFQIFQEALSIAQIFIESLIEAVRGFVESLLPGKDIFKSLNDAIHSVIKNLYLMAIGIAKFLGLTGVVDNLIKHLENKANPSTKTAAQPAQIKGFEQIAKDIALKAASAGGGGAGGVESDREHWRETAEAAKSLAANTESFQQTLERILNEIKDKLPGVPTKKDVGDFVDRNTPDIFPETNIKKRLGLKSWNPLS